MNSTIPAPYEVKNPLAIATLSDSTMQDINLLWFSSLALSLITAILAMLIKQWLITFRSRMRVPSPSPKTWAMRHSALKGGLDRWHVDAIIASLPLFLHGSVFYFLHGLCSLLLPLSHRSGIIVTYFAGFTGAVYLATSIIPVFWTSAPTFTPISLLADGLFRLVIGPALQWSLLVLYLVFIACPGMVLLGLPYAAYLQRRTGDWDFTKGPVVGVLRLGLDYIAVRKGEGCVLAFWRCRLKAWTGPGTSQNRLFSETDHPLREASVLAWMIRSLSPSSDEFNAAVSAVGRFSAGAHHAYFHAKKLVSPLKDMVVGDIIYHAFNSVVQGGITDDAMVAAHLRACLYVAVGPLVVSNQGAQFLQHYVQLDPQYDIHGLRSLSISVLHNGQDWPHSSSLELGDVNTELAELIALSGHEGRHRTQLITRLVITAAEIAKPRYSASIISALESEMLAYRSHGLGGWTPRVSEDPRLRFIAALDFGLRHPDRLEMKPEERCAFVSAYGAAARSLASDTKVNLPPDLQHFLRLTTDQHFSEYDFSATDLIAIGTLLARKVPEGRTSIDPLALSGILEHFKRRSLPLLSDGLGWIQSAFKVPSDLIGLLEKLQRRKFVELALYNSHFGLLRKIELSPSAPTQSAWGLLLDLVPLSDFEHHLIDLACPYAVQLAVLQSRGHSDFAVAMLRELLPVDRSVSIINRGSSSRFHLTLHAKLICNTWWLEIRDILPRSAWAQCSRFPDANSFVDALSAASGCIECAQNSLSTPLGSNPPLPSHGVDLRDHGSGQDITGPISSAVDLPLMHISIPMPPSEQLVADSSVIGGTPERSRGEGEGPEGLLEGGLYLDHPVDSDVI